MLVRMLVLVGDLQEELALASDKYQNFSFFWLYQSSIYLGYIQELHLEHKHSSRKKLLPEHL